MNKSSKNTTWKFFSVKIKHVMYTMHYFLFMVVFFKHFLDFMHSCDNWLMSGGNNKPYALNKPATFTYGLLPTLSAKYKAAKFSPKCYATKSSTCFNVNVITSWWLFYKCLFRVGPGQLVLYDSTFMLKKKWMCVNILHSFIARVIL